MSAPSVHQITAPVEPVATVGNDLETDVGRCPHAGTVTAVTYTPATAITGAATNNRTFVLVNKGLAGTGTTVVASLNMASGVNAAADDEKAITLTATAADKVVAEGDILAFQSTHIGTGIADPGGLVRVEVTRGDVSA
jgi:hypothetical protein